MKRPSRCRQCGRVDTEVGRISRRGLCTECACDNLESVHRQLSAKDGPAYNLWLKRWQSAQAEYSRSVAERIDAETRQLG